ncbi:MAG: hypothetical protein ACK2U5_01075 [Candidatus Promineifilaceae bacterium]|jgi:hypothetical protein
MLLGLGCGCLLALGIGLAPRIFLIIAWIFSTRWQIVWQGDWLVPLLGIIFLPYTTVMYMLAWSAPNGVTGWEWMWVALGVLLDVMKWSSMIKYRKENEYYPATMP